MSYLMKKTSLQLQKIIHIRKTNSKNSVQSSLSRVCDPLLCLTFFIGSGLMSMFWF